MNCWPLNSSSPLAPRVRFERVHSRRKLGLIPVDVIDPSPHQSIAIDKLVRDFSEHRSRGQWRIFLQRLMEANYVIVVGYSLPDLDTSAREAMLVAFP